MMKKITQVMLPLLAFTLVLLPNILALIFKFDAWPVSSYPMFSIRKSIENVTVFRLKMEGREGSVFWWKPPHSYHSRNFGYDYSKAYWADSKVIGNQSIERLKVIKAYLKVIEPDLLSDINSIIVVRRTAKWSENGFVVTDVEELRYDPKS